MRVRAVVLSLACLFLPGTVLAGCTVSAEPVVFGTISLADMNFARGYVRVSCDAPTDVTLALSAGSSGDYARRHMVGPRGARLLYQIYANQRTYDIWGDGSGGTVTVGGHVAAGETREFPMHGLVPAGQAVPEGSYSDSLVVTLNF